MGDPKLFDKYSPLVKEAYVERIAGLKELEDLRQRRVSETSPGNEVSPDTPKKETIRGIHTEMPVKHPISHTTFKDLISKVRIKAETLGISGIEHLGVIHDLCPTSEPKVFRFFGDRYIATVSFETVPPSILDMKETPDRTLQLFSNYQVRCQGRP